MLPTGPYERDATCHLKFNSFSSSSFFFPEQLPEHRVPLERLGDLEVPLDGDAREVLLGPRQPVVHHVRRHHLHQQQGQLLARLLGGGKEEAGFQS